MSTCLVPVAGIPVMLKVEDQPEQSLLRQPLQWQLPMAIRFSLLQRCHKWCIKLEYTYDKVALFWFGSSGNDEVFTDDVEFRGSGGGSGPNPGAGTSPYCETNAFHLVEIQTLRFL